ncbi:MAG: hypothetical protein K2G23_09060 [Muribaculaceae bacterium]|nr:hypothetical protein [Muribaculaceae bacterium]
MKQFIIIFFAASLAFLPGSCGTQKSVNYANREWHISNYYGQIIDKDTAYRMTFGNVLIPLEIAIISCADSAAKYPGMERFIADILKTAGLQDDEVLFFTPEFGKIFVELKNDYPANRPSSLTAGMPLLTLQKENERPYTMWVYDDDVEDWHRKPDQMYTYTYFDKKNQRILVVDLYDYGETPIAEISVTQSRSKYTDKMQLPTQGKFWDFSKYKLKDYERDVEFWSHRVELHRNNAFDNYVIGQEQLNKKK